MKTRSIFTENSNYLKHHGIQGQKWGIQNGPPYPLSERNPSRVYYNSINDEYGHDSDVAKAYAQTYKKYSDEVKAYGKTGLYMTNDRKKCLFVVENGQDFIDSKTAGLMAYRNAQSVVNLTRAAEELDKRYSADPPQRILKMVEQMRNAQKTRIDHTDLFKRISDTLYSVEHPDENPNDEYYNPNLKYVVYGKNKNGQYVPAERILNDKESRRSTANILGLGFLLTCSGGLLTIPSVPTFALGMTGLVGTGVAMPYLDEAIRKSSTNQILKNLENISNTIEDPSMIDQYYTPQNINRRT